MARKTDAVKLEEKPERDDRCIAEYAGMRCHYPWSISDSPSGKRGWCRHHYRLEPGADYLNFIGKSAEWLAEKTS